MRTVKTNQHELSYKLNATYALHIHRVCDRFYEVISWTKWVFFSTMKFSILAYKFPCVSSISILVLVNFIASETAKATIPMKREGRGVSTDSLVAFFLSL
jgi:hypothetical protein